MQLRSPAMSHASRVRLTRFWCVSRPPASWREISRIFLAHNLSNNIFNVATLSKGGRSGAPPRTPMWELAALPNPLADGQGAR